MATKAESIFDRVNTMVEGGMSQADAFKQIAEEESRPLDSVRGSFYTGRKQREGDSTPKRTRRRETTPEDAVADARASLERAIHAIDNEIEAAEHRATEAAEEAKSLKETAAERKKAIAKRLEALT
jgi:rubrerythrin